MAMRSMLAGAGRSFARAAVRPSLPPVLTTAPTIGTPIRAPRPSLLTSAPPMSAPVRASPPPVPTKATTVSAPIRAPLTSAPPMGAPIRAGQVATLPRAPGIGAPLGAAEASMLSKAPALGLNSAVGISFSANAAASTGVAASRVLAPRAAAARLWSGKSAGVKAPFAARGLSTTKPHPAGRDIWVYVLAASAFGAAAIVFFVTSVEEHIDDTSFGHVHDLDEGELPEFVDWSQKLNFPFVADPLYNTNCGSCWAVTGVKSIEAYLAIRKGVLFHPLSIQQMIDCARINGCGGGSLSRAYNYAAATGLTSEEAYRGPAHPGILKGRSFLRGLLMRYCDLKGKPIVARIRGYERILPTEKSLMRALQSGPVAVMITASTAFNTYRRGGILELHQCPPSDKPNHAVLVVGYNTSKEGVKYWIIMNTWGPGYGNRGYCFFRRVGAGEGVGGITKFSGYRPVLA